MKTVAFAKALRFACLPTLSILILLFFGFFSISETINFISSSNGWAIFLRVVLVIAEIALIIFMYEKYRGEEEAKELSKENGADMKGRIRISAHTNIYNIIPNSNWSSSDDYFIYPCENTNVIVIKREPRIKS